MVQKGVGGATQATLRVSGSALALSLSLSEGGSALTLIQDQRFLVCSKHLSFTVLGKWSFEETS